MNRLPQIRQLALLIPAIYGDHHITDRPGVPIGLCIRQDWLNKLGMETNNYGRTTDPVCIQGFYRGNGHIPQHNRFGIGYALNGSLILCNRPPLATNPASSGLSIKME